MSETVDRAQAVARALWSHAAAHVHPSTDTATIIDALLTQLEGGLRRWVGTEGYAALLARSVALTIPMHAALSAIPDLAGGMNAGHGNGALSMDDTAYEEAIVALLATMMRQLGSIVGEPMAIRLIEISGTPSPRISAGPEDSDISP